MDYKTTIKSKIKDILEREAIGNINDAILREHIEKFILETFKTEYNDIKVICDRTNNSPEDIDNKLLNVDIYIPYSLLNFKTSIGKDGVYYEDLL